MLQLYSILALDIARDREREARHDQLVDLAHTDADSGRNGLRRGLATGLAVVSRGSAAAVRRLDDCVADDLTEALVAGR
jgi:hypothetical protein